MIPNLPCATCIQLYALDHNWPDTCEYLEEEKCTYCQNIPGKKCLKIPTSLEVLAQEIIYVTRCDNPPTKYIEQLGLDFRKLFSAHQEPSNPPAPAEDKIIYIQSDSDSDENVEPELDLPPESDPSEYVDESTSSGSEGVESDKSSSSSEEIVSIESDDDNDDTEQADGDGDDSESDEDEDPKPPTARKLPVSRPSIAKRIRSTPRRKASRYRN